MITAIFTELRLVVYGHGTPKGMVKLVDTELAGRSHPMTSTFHVFLNTIINRYKDEMTDVFYPLAVNVVFPSRSYTSSIERKHLLDYILDRQEVIRLRDRKCLMQACIEGWCSTQDVYHPAWLAISIENDMVIGAKESRTTPLKIKVANASGRSVILKELKEYVSATGTPQEIQIVRKVDGLGQKEVNQIFNTSSVDLEFAENQEVPDTSISIAKTFCKDILKNQTNIIFLHINNLYSKLPNTKPVFFIGGFVNIQSIQDSLQENGLKYDYQTVFISDEEMPTLAATSFSHNNLTQKLSSTGQTQESTTAQGTTAFDKEVKQESSPQSQTLIQINNAQAATSSKEEVTQSLISDEFVIEKRFSDQEFLLFKGYRKSKGVKRYYRFISHEDYKSIDRRAAFIKLYKKVQLIYPEISTLIKSKAGHYYYLEDMGAQPLKQVIARSRIKKGSNGIFKSEDIQLLLDIYKKLDELPITFQNLTIDNIYVKQKGWWRVSGTNEVYFLGITSADSTKEEMTSKLDDLIKQSVHPTIIERINHI